MLIPVYIAGFILGGLILFAIARQIPNRGAKVCLRAIAVFSGPVFFLVVAIFSGWQREKTYEMEWLVGKPAAAYLGFENSDGHLANSAIAIGPVTKKEEEIVVLKRNIGANRECFDSFASNALAHYLESLPTDRVQVRYLVTYDFYAPRGYRVETIGEFGHEPAEQSEILMGALGGGTKSSQASKEPCFTW